MSYQALARKWRPKKFSDIIGQQDIIKAIENSFVLNKIHHAYILSGSKGTGKTTIARLFAKGLNCNAGPTYSICNCCKNCQAIELGCFNDLIEIDAAYYTKVEDIRDFLDNVQYVPYHGKFKIYLIDEVHMLSKHSFNALLKNLEEPPSYTKFILVTTESHKLPETIRSRCLQFYLKPLSISQIAKQLLRICSVEQIKLDQDSSLLLANASQGSMRDALNLLEQAILFSSNNITVDMINKMLGTVHIEQALFLIEQLVNGDLDSLMSQFDNYTIIGIDWDCLCKEILNIFQKIAINQFSPDFFKKRIDKSNIKKNIESRVSRLSYCITPDNVQLYYQIFLLSRRELPYAPSFRIGMEMAFLRALAFLPCKIDLNSKQDNSGNFSGYENQYTCNKQNQEKCTNNINNMQMNNINNNLLLSKSNCNNIDFKKMDLTCNNIHINNATAISSGSVKKISNFTDKILDVRSKLIEYQRNVNKTNLNKRESHSHDISQKISRSILDKFYGTYIDTQDKCLNNKKKK